MKNLPVTTKYRRTSHAIVLAALLTICATSVYAGGPEGCEPEPIGPNTPTGVKGCVVYGEGTASMWGGPGVARNDCVWPWDDCQPIAIQSLETGITIVVTPTMFGDLYTGTSDERIVDLDPAAVAALGLDPSKGLWPVYVSPVGSGNPYPPVREGESAHVLAPPVLPDTAVRP